VVETASLSDIRHPRVSVSDIALDADGTILVATSDGLITTPLQVHQTINYRLGSCAFSKVSAKILGKLLILLLLLHSFLLLR